MSEVKRVGSDVLVDHCVSAEDVCFYSNQCVSALDEYISAVDERISAVRAVEVLVFVCLRSIWQKCDLDRARFVRLALMVIMWNDGNFMDVILVYLWMCNAVNVFLLLQISERAVWVTGRRWMAVASA
jgi:hypothetical protein